MKNISVHSKQLFQLKVIQLDNETQQTVNARDLHKFLESKQEFSNWIKKRIKEYGFIENEDFIKEKGFRQIYQKLQPVGDSGVFVNVGGRPTLDYHITLDMAKELAMIENNPKGRQVRRYFIQCEKLLKEQLLEQQNKKLLILENKLNEAKIKCRQFDAIVAQPCCLNFRKVAKKLTISERVLKAWLIQNNWISLQGSDKKMSPKSWVIKKFYMVFKHQYTKNGDISKNPIALFTNKGIKEIQYKLMCFGLQNNNLELFNNSPRDF